MIVHSMLGATQKPLGGASHKCLGGSHLGQNSPARCINSLMIKPCIHFKALLPPSDFLEYSPVARYLSLINDASECSLLELSLAILMF